MREGQTLPVRREDYAAPAYWIRRVELTFDLDPVKTIVGAKLTIERNPDQPAQPLRLDGEGLNLLRVLADGDSVAFRHDDGDLVVELPLERERVVLEIRNTCAPEANTELSGLYTSRGGFFTQCEAQGFRRITYFLDRPDVMAVYTVTLRADKKRYPKLLCNGNLVAEGALEGGRHFATWHDPHPKPSYLFALVAADLACREQRVRSRAGRVIRAIRDAESRTRFLGYRVESYKLWVFVFSAAIAGIAGALYVPQVGIINPSEFQPINSIEVVIWVAVGGRGTLIGAALGAILVNYAKTFLTGALPEAWLYALGTLFVLVTLFLPRGLVGLIPVQRSS